jgi:hypothetical protein
MKLHTIPHSAGLSCIGNPAEQFAVPNGIDQETRRNVALCPVLIEVFEANQTDSLRVSSDAERPLPSARGMSPGRSEGKKSALKHGLYTAATPCGLRHAACKRTSFTSRYEKQGIWPSSFADDYSHSPKAAIPGQLAAKRNREMESGLIERVLALGQGW